VTAAAAAVEAEAVTAAEPEAVMVEPEAVSVAVEPQTVHHVPSVFGHKLVTDSPGHKLVTGDCKAPQDSPTADSAWREQQHASEMQELQRALREVESQLHHKDTVHQEQQASFNLLLATQERKLNAELNVHKSNAQLMATELNAAHKETAQLLESQDAALLCSQESLAAELLLHKQQAEQSKTELEKMHLVIDNLKADHETTRAELAVAMSGGVQKVERRRREVEAKQEAARAVEERKEVQAKVTTLVELKEKQQEELQQAADTIMQLRLELSTATQTLKREQASKAALDERLGRQASELKGSHGDIRRIQQEMRDQAQLMSNQAADQMRGLRCQSESAMEEASAQHQEKVRALEDALYSTRGQADRHAELQELLEQAEDRIERQQKSARANAIRATEEENGRAELHKCLAQLQQVSDQKQQLSEALEELQRDRQLESKMPMSARTQMEVRVIHQKLREAQAETAQAKQAHQLEVAELQAQLDQFTKGAESPRASRTKLEQEINEAEVEVDRFEEMVAAFKDSPRKSPSQSKTPRRASPSRTPRGSPTKESPTKARMIAQRLDPTPDFDFTCSPPSPVPA